MGKVVGLLSLAGVATDGGCRAAENGVPCSAAAKFRGLCRRHYWAAKARRLVDQLGLPPVQLKHDIRLKPPTQLQLGICRVVVNGDRPIPAQRRGVCARHYAAIWQRPDLRLDDFAAAPITSGDFRVRKRRLADRCHIVERDVPCEEPPHARGLCKGHYAWLRAIDMDAFERLAERDRNSILYTLRIRLRADRCRVAENGQPCGEKDYCLGLCAHHYAVLFDKRELFDQIALPARK